MNEINVSTYRNMLLSAAANLSNHKQEVDEMNVFPVPDGDTGTNMSMTMDACEAALIGNDLDTIGEVSKLVANAALRGARGNSGVILSQLLRGVQKALANADVIDCTLLSLAVQSAAHSAYKAVMKPTEGTILTVARKMAEFAQKNEEKFDDVIKFAEAIIEAGDRALAKTPDILPQLKQAGVVDSGGQGLMYLCKGAFSALAGEMRVERTEASSVQVTGAKSVEVSDLKYKYCTECIIEKDSKKADAFALKLAIEPKGDSMVVVDDDEIIKIHIHTDRPDFVLAEALNHGELSNIKIENMLLQHNSIINNSEKTSEKEETKPEKEYGFVCVAAGEGLVSTFKNLGVDIVIEGGQTMNPSTDDILSAVESINAKNIFVYPNNKNIIMAAQQASELSDKNVYVIPTKSIVQALSSILVFDEDSDAETNFGEMSEVISEVKSAQLTYAVRDTIVDDKPIAPGDILGILEGKISYVGTETDETVLALLDEMVNDDSSVITLFYGEGIESEAAENLKSVLEEKYEDCDVYMHFGGQPVYYYFISVE